MVVDSVPQQLRTPSPSEAASNGPAAHMASPPALSSPKPALPPTPEALHALVSTIPTKTLHAYVLAQLPTAPPDTLAALASFFATLTPPPRLHCVRCHSDYTDIENTDRSCHVPHDDDSAYVERVGIVGRGGSEYETQYGCCGKTVEGEGDLGPPDGWCYEGMHTVSCSTPSPLLRITFADPSFYRRTQSAHASAKTRPLLTTCSYPASASTAITSVRGSRAQQAQAQAAGASSGPAHHPVT